MEYDIAVAPTVLLLEIRVREQIANGWRPQGGVSVVYEPYEPSGCIWAQAMVKEAA